ncbi:MAG TPA: PVC-type heme-binding CxxCH protein [Caulifigura sp.]|jgi:putative membrane-bound dehydrogenase-like protein|nr:PVC-type heme-binding CxxCH protein [Caulifigura sp.]
MTWRGLSLILAVVLGSASILEAQVLVVPRRHDRPPGPPLSAQDAVAKMTVPEGFTVDIVASEPDVVNPVAMFIDEKGRFWITESFEYPRQEAGPGRDRIKVLEDTDGDGKVDKVTVFAEGLNIPSGIAVGHGGVWVANAPDILFLQDTDGDLKADKTEVIMTGFGRTDTHELPNSFTWGPDGWLYGLNGVFNYCDVTYGKDNPNAKPDHPGWKFTCALFRIHPRTREFQIFCEGTSNPWGLAINDKGDFFISACVIDHLWHLTERGYYIRQGGPYPAHTWPIGSIVKHEHQKAAYCGITWFDSNAYPAEYRNTLYMGNIHGNCINADVVEPKGATYVGKPHPGFTAKADAWKNDQYGVIRKTGDEKNPKLADLLQANDQWFMPVVQKTGPDGCLYILDWYDQYHCYQDANADPAGIDRAKGRLYRLRYKDNPYVKPFDLAKKTDDELIELLRDSNVFYRESAQRLLAERKTPEISGKLLARIQQGNAPSRDPYRELLTLGSLPVNGNAPLDGLLKHSDPIVRAWGLRSLGNRGNLNEAEAALCRAMVDDDSPVVRLQAVVTAAKAVTMIELKREILLRALSAPQLDSQVAHVAWECLKPLITIEPEPFLDAARSQNLTGRQLPIEVVERVFDLLLGMDDMPYESFAAFLKSTGGSRGANPDVLTMAFWKMAMRLQSRPIHPKRKNEFVIMHTQLLQESLGGPRDQPLWWATANLSASLGGESGQYLLLYVLLNAEDTPETAARRIEGFRTLVNLNHPRCLELVERQLDSKVPTVREQMLLTLSRLDDPKVAPLILEAFPRLGPLKPKAIELLTQRASWSHALLEQISRGAIPATALNLNQVRRVGGFRDEALQAKFVALYGKLRETRNPDREHVIGNMRNILDTIPGDPHAGHAVFKKVCGQCHKIHGEGAEVGPDITSNGRNNWEQLLSNVLDPSLVIGKGYQARILATADGRVLTGLPVEETEQQIVLKVQGGKLETIPRSEVEADKLSELSMMPEALEKQLTPQELADLFAFLALDKPPTDPGAKQLSGSPKQKGR